MDFSSRQLRALLLVAQHRSFSRAAEALFITPSGLSVLIRQLETHLGFRLFDRTTRHVTLTNWGKDLLEVTRRSLGELDAAMSRIGRSATEASQLLSVGAAPLVAANILPQAIKEFRGYRPDLRIEVFEGAHAVILRMIQAGKLDMGVGVFLGPARGIRRKPFFRFSLMVIRPDSDSTLPRATTRWSALKGERLISLIPTHPIQRLIDKHLGRSGVDARPALVLSQLDTMIAMVEADQGIAIIPSFALLACRNRKVKMSRLINPIVNLEFHQISSRAKKSPPGAQDFTYFLQSHIARWAGRSGVL